MEDKNIVQTTKEKAARYTKTAILPRGVRKTGLWKNR